MVPTLSAGFKGSKSMGVGVGESCCNPFDPLTVGQGSFSPEVLMFIPEAPPEML